MSDKSFTNIGNNLSREKSTHIIQEDLKHSLLTLENLLRSSKYLGYDPYDALNCENLDRFNNKLLNILFTQGLVYSPFNLRKLLGISKGRNPKAIGLLMKTYCLISNFDFLPKKFCISLAELLAKWLIINRSKKSSHYCWGFNFPWQASNRKLDSGTPTIVNSSFIGDAFLSLYDLTGKKEYLTIVESICDFILEDLNISQFDEGICFSYSPIDNYLVHNANVLGASLLAKYYSRNPKDKYMSYSKKAFDFTISHQKENGMWKYSLDKSKESERHQIDWHQGFILDSIFDIIESSVPTSEKYLDTLIKGSEFYINKQFFPSGRSKWRWPIIWPADIHNQAQGIITLSKLSKYNKNYSASAQVILTWTIDNMKDSKGFFYYQKWPFFTNKIDYIRWNQSWMLLALATFLSRTTNKI
tara:strand:+ start:816 stop:2060 length:1245 start_codon:yes stop_codon:yes gene_type:complete